MELGQVQLRGFKETHRSEKGRKEARAFVNYVGAITFPHPEAGLWDWFTMRRHSRHPLTCITLIASH